MSEQESPDMNEGGGDMEEQLSPDQLPEGAFEGEMGEAMEGMDGMDGMNGMDGMDGQAMEYGCKCISSSNSHRGGDGGWGEPRDGGGITWWAR
jgi:hypothetical protein